MATRKRSISFVHIIRQVALLSILVISFALHTFPANSKTTQTFTVTKYDDTNDGQCSPADCSLREAIIAANAANGIDTINLLPGTYPLSIIGLDEDLSATGDLDILDGLLISGSDMSSTTIDANGIDRVFHILEASQAVTITGVTIQNGLIPASDALGGGGILSSNGSLTLSDVTVKDNMAKRGGGVRNDQGNLIITGSIIIENGDLNSTEEGGGIFSDGTVNISTSEINQNRSKNGGGINGTELATMILDRVVLDGNHAQLQGGGILNDKTIQLTKVTLSNNRATTGGGIYSSFFANLLDVTIDHNISNSSGAGIYSDGSLNLINTTISSNNTGDTGGGIYNEGYLGISSVTVFQNQAANGGGIYNDESGTMIVRNTIIAENTNGNCKNFFGVLTSNGNNIEDGNTCQFTAPGDLPNTSPLLEPLQDNSGTTFTHALELNSPAIDAGNSTTCPGTDQRDMIRPIDGNFDNLPGCDIGAYELAPSGDVAFNPRSYVTEEKPGKVTATVTRPTAVGTQTVSVDYYLVPHQDNDFVPVQGTFTWENGDKSPKSFDITILDDPHREEDETFPIVLTNPFGGIGMFSPNHIAELTILANDGGGPNAPKYIFLPILYK